MRVISTDEQSPELTKLMELSRRLFEAEENGDRGVLASLLTDDFKIVRSNLTVSDLHAMLDKVSANAGLGRVVVDSGARIFGNIAVVTSLVTTKNQDPEGRFWNTQVFVKTDGEWPCRAWQVARLL